MKMEYVGLIQEMEKDTGAVESAKGRLDSVRREAASEASRSGAGAVENSIAVQDMKSSLNLPQAAPAAGLSKQAPSSAGAAPAGYRAAQETNYAQQVRVVNGRAFYQNSGTWTDSTAQSQKTLKQKQVRFGSAEYFALLKANPGLATWLALGSNLDVVVDGTLVIISE